MRVTLLTHCPSLCLTDTFQLFYSLYIVGRNGTVGIKEFNNSKKELPPVGLNLMQEIITGLGTELSWHLFARLLDPYIIMLFWFQLKHTSPKNNWCTKKSLKFP